MSEYEVEVGVMSPRPLKEDTILTPSGPKGILTEGVKFDTNKPRTDLLPHDALMDVADVLDYGAKKYAVRNWEKGMAWGRLSGAAMRHLFLWMSGEEIDKESGKRHLAHFACCALMLLALTLRGTGSDDRR